MMDNWMMTINTMEKGFTDSKHKVNCMKVISKTTNSMAMQN